MTQQQFLDKIIPSFQKWGKQYGYKIISAAIAQACLESGYGTSYKATFGHNILGLKYRPNRVDCNSGYFLDGGSEQNTDGTYTLLPSVTSWYNFKDWDACIHGYYQFIAISNYNKVREAQTSLEYLQAIKAAGYSSSLKYVENVYKVVNGYNLTKYDEIGNAGTGTTFNTPNIDIIQSFGVENMTKANNRNIKYIVVHYTAGTKSSKGTARSTANYFNKSTTKASADFIVDDAEIVQYNPNLKNHYCWAVGGSKYTSLSTSLGAKYYGQCTNANSISIEMCSCKTNTTSLKASDDDWYLTDATVNNTAKLVKYLMKEYNIDINHVIMHHMVTGKWCPQPWCKNELSLPLWYNFLNKIQAGAGSNAAIQPAQTVVTTPAAAYPSTPFIVTVKVPNLNIRRTPNGEITGKFTGKGKFTITKINGDWGFLKSGAGWIYLKNKSYVDY